MDNEKIKKTILKFERSKANVKFTDLQKFIEMLGFLLKEISGSHHVYGKDGHSPLSVQRDKRNKNKAKKYQVDQAIKRAKRMMGGN